MAKKTKEQLELAIKQAELEKEEGSFLWQIVQILIDKNIIKKENLANYPALRAKSDKIDKLKQ